MNALRSVLYEFGHVFPKGIAHLRRIAAILADPASDLPALMREECHDLLEQISEQTARIEAKLFKLMEKTRDGARMSKRYHAPLTPFQRGQAHPAVSRSTKQALMAQFDMLDPVILLRDIRAAQARLVALADNTHVADGVYVEQFLKGLRHAWKEGEVRPTSRQKLSAPRCSRRPDPLAKVTDDLRALFDAAMAQTERELLSKLQFSHPEAYPDGLLRRVQRRLKIWRPAIARELVFGASQVASDQMTPGALRDVEASRVGVGGHQNPTVVLASPNEIREHLVEATA